MEEILIKWQTPPEESLWLSKETLREGWRKLAFTILIIIVLALLVYLPMTKLPTEELNFGKSVIASSIGGFVIALLFYLLLPYLTRFSRPIYKITEKGLVTEKKRYPWKLITDYAIENSPELDGLKILNLTINNRLRCIYLPEDFPVEKALLIFSTYITKQQPKKLKPKTKLQLSTADKTLIFIFCIVYFSISYFCFNNIKEVIARVGEPAGPILLLLIGIAPGPISLLCIKGPKAFKSSNAPLIAYAISFSFIGVSLVFIVAKIFYDLYKQFN